jgi:tubby and related proteins
MKPLPALIGQV